MTDGNGARIRPGLAPTPGLTPTTTAAAPTRAPATVAPAPGDLVESHATPALARRLDAARTMTAPVPRLDPPATDLAPQKLRDLERRFDDYPDLFQRSELVVPYSLDAAVPSISSGQGLRVMACVGPEARALFADWRHKPALVASFEAHLAARNPEMTPLAVQRLAAALYDEVRMRLPVHSDADLLTNRRNLLGLGVEALAHELEALPAYRGLSDASRRDLARLTGGARSRFSIRARAELLRFVAEASFVAAPRDEQVRRLDRWLGDYPGTATPYNSRAQQTEPGRGRGLLSAPERSATLGAPAGEGSRERRTITLDGHTIPLVRPPIAHGSAGATLPASELVAEALALLPAPLRGLITRIELHEHDNPLDAHWATVYNQAGFKSQFTASATGEINGYPASSTWELGELRGYLAHEVGHIYAYRMMGTDAAGAGWAEWRAAIAADRFAPSGYARKNPSEYFGEFLQQYLDVQGTPEAAELRAIFPASTRALEALFSRPLPPA